MSQQRRHLLKSNTNYRYEEQKKLTYMTNVLALVTKWVALISRCKANSTIHILFKQVKPPRHYHPKHTGNFPAKWFLQLALSTDGQEGA